MSFFLFQTEYLSGSFTFCENFTNYCGWDYNWAYIGVIGGKPSLGSRGSRVGVIGGKPSLGSRVGVIFGRTFTSHHIGGKTSIFHTCSVT
ncbi:unnamed protein product, partial [Vitis vinifera]|uniref:Uncharacterized protein n=1 Tax=Vitis vinifera TaxID=29760 RepID=D7TXJ1_VITVI